MLQLFQFFVTRFLYFALHLDAGSFPRPLTLAEERAAFQALEKGDSNARDKLIRHNLRLVAHISKKYYAAPGDQEDLISIGTIGLIKAVDTFDHDRKARFSTYASKCIENAILTRWKVFQKDGVLRHTIHKKNHGQTLPQAKKRLPFYSLVNGSRCTPHA